MSTSKSAAINTKKLIQIQPYAQSKLDISGSCVVCSIGYCINSHLSENGKPQVPIERLLQTAIEHKFFSASGNGIHSKGTENIGKLFGKVEWGFFGNSKEEDEFSDDEIDENCRKRQYFGSELSQSNHHPYENGQDLIRDKLKQGYSGVVVGVRACMQSCSRATTHAVVAIAIDDSNRVTIADSYSHFTKRNQPTEFHPHGKPVWEFSPGVYTVEWDEFNASWNSRDDYAGEVDLENDEAFSTFNSSEEGFRFWMVIQPDFKLISKHIK